ncbi:CPBP family intramembrane glutamic endopeptidase [Anaerofustis stercorihominis]|uniref:CPBP family intramembrane metalloprotease n=2 Tax=Anaerofustis stercorihominis TaxID=214853 RepID=A0A3E3E0L4_9FIRM|nr:CPBP family intramembrane metalloprotease [Anaerofustis stercorihominis]
MKNKKIMKTILLLFFICSAVEYIEFLFIRTDMTFIADNIITKIFIVFILFISLKSFQLKFSDIGFKFKGILKGIIYGISLGIITFTISYFIEILILTVNGHSPSIKFFITNFALTGASNSLNASLTAVMICIVVNILNAAAEEGLFRGLFLNLGQKKYSFKTANYIQALLFGIWHFVMVAVSLYDKTMNLQTAVVMGIGYIVLAGILGIEWGLCVSMTGTLWINMSEHFFNNFISNTIHVVSSTGIDELQIIRIVMSNILSLVIVIAVSKIVKK